MKLNSNIKTKKEKRPLFISITGNIGSGKSLVSNYLKNNGFSVYSADSISHEILQKKETILHLVEIFGKKIITKKQIDRGKLREMVFENKDKLIQLNDFMHKKILVALHEIIKGYYGHKVKKNVVFFEIPLLFECNLDKCFDLNVLISAEEHILIDRVIERDQCSKEQVILILNNQIPQINKVKMADVILLNNSTIDFLNIQIILFLQFIDHIKKRKLKEIIK